VQAHHILTVGIGDDTRGYFVSATLTVQCQQELKSSDCLQQHMGPKHHTEQIAYSKRICISVHNRTNRPSTCKFISRHRIATLLLLNNTLTLLSFDRRIRRTHGSFHSIIPTKSPIRRNIHRSKYNILPTTLSRINWHTATIIKLPRSL
jgi:hypothetical protein